MSGQAMKKCPFCGEEIRAEAIKCRYCRELLDTAQPPVPPQTQLQNAPSREHNKEGSPVEPPAGKPNIPPKNDVDQVTLSRKIFNFLGKIIPAVILLFIILGYWNSPNNQSSKALEKVLENWEAGNIPQGRQVPPDNSRKVLEEMMEKTNFAAKVKIKQYQDDLFRRQAQMLRELSGTDKILVETLLKAKIFWKDVVTLPLSFAKAKVFKIEDHNSFNILIYPELSPEGKKYVEDLFPNGGVNSADGMHIAGVIQNIETASQNGKYITVLLDGDMIKIIKTSPEISVGF